MHLLKDASFIAVGTTVLAAGLLVANVGPNAPDVSTSAALTALLLTFIGITVNAHRSATPARTMGRLLHDSEETAALARRMPAVGVR